MTTSTEVTGVAAAGPRHGEWLKALGLRCTKPRLAVLGVLAERGGHLSATAIHRAVAAGGGVIDASTVYRTVERLADVGLLHRVPVGDEARYGLSGGVHHHAVCADCGLIVDVPAAALSRVLAEVEVDSGFALEAVVLTGRCPRCRARDGRVAEPAGRPVAG